jgi:hypothetical protein
MEVAGFGLRAMREDDDQESLTFRRALRAPEFWLLLVASVAATVGVAWWVSCLLEASLEASAFVPISH